MNGARHLHDDSAIASTKVQAVQALQSGKVDLFARAVSAAKADGAKSLALSEAFSQVAGSGQVLSAASALAAASARGEPWVRDVWFMLLGFTRGPHYGGWQNHSYMCPSAWLGKHHLHFLNNVKHLLCRRSSCSFQGDCQFSGICESRQQPRDCPGTGTVRHPGRPSSCSISKLWICQCHECWKGLQRC